eukprot:Plantae.Rhodophyta-Hildenbrandia_rubra.ctg1121.p1 GENE.Plantae.Rhodophyta-Hildenbrandia_rubra.ctg1121~~Plantae.Rhodophyta-Hildenbrandia_rubra.ctg1121.p1  ORF type:complete len:1138 (-),score=234.26 Plantae.Rhodophyta-Hildenbrandia_rubra.ctg1121:257-3262(-)
MVASVPSGDVKAREVTSRNIGENVKGFELVREEWVGELGSTVRMWRYNKTGTELMSVLNNDENKTFGVVFRTPPKDSTGVPHILEHSVLCGSRRYPVKEPFVELMKSSLQTFLNAFTYPDKTCYPVASCNQKDFYNLVDVYMDAVFHPRLTRDTLAQEGHHLELENVGGEASIKGVVYNEMKGAYSNPDRVMGELSQRVLFPDTTYGVESGGHPRDIPSLTWEQFDGFYKEFYHPSNARLWFYGDDPEELRLEKAAEFLRDFDKISVKSDVGLQKRWDKPKDFSFTYDAGAGDNLESKVMSTINWMIDPPVDKMDVQESLALSILSHILLSMSASPLRKALTESELGEDVIGGGLESDLRQMTFSVGLKGMKEESVEKMRKVVWDVLRDVQMNGFPENMVESSINTIEFRLRENNTGSFPKGLSYMLRAMSTWLHDADPLEPLRFEEPLATFKKRLANKEPVFQNIVTKYLVDNSHRATVTIKPDAEYAKKEDALEREKVKGQVSKMTEADLKKLIEETSRLRAKQAAADKPEDLAKIPVLTRDDLDKKIKTVPVEEAEYNGVKVLHHPLFTNGIVYMDLFFEMSNISPDLLPLMSIFAGALTELGTTKQDFVSLQQSIGRETGGIRSSTFISQTVAPDGKGPAVAKFVIRGKGMTSQVPSLLDLTEEILIHVDLNNKDRIRQYLLEERSGLESGIVSSGHSVASSRLGAMLRSSQWADEKMGGIDYLIALRSIINRVESDWDSVVRDLKKVQDIIISRENMLVNITVAPEDYKKVDPALKSFLSRLPEKPSQSSTSWTNGQTLLTRRNEALVVPSAVNYVGKAGNLCDLGFKPTGAHSLAAKHLGTSYMWDTVRVQGGAYGGFCRLDARTGNFMYLSYRDPNINATLKAYDGAAKFLKEANVADDEMTKSVIGLIGSLDSYELPDAKGFSSAVRYMTGQTDEIRQERRDQVLGATNKDFRELGEALEEIKKNGTVVIVGGEEAIKKAQEEGLDLNVRNIM